MPSTGSRCRNFTAIGCFFLPAVSSLCLYPFNIIYLCLPCNCGMLFANGRNGEERLLSPPGHRPEMEANSPRLSAGWISQKDDHAEKWPGGGTDGKEAESGGLGVCTLHAQRIPASQPFFSEGWPPNRAGRPSFSGRGSGKPHQSSTIHPPCHCIKRRWRTCSAG